MNKIQTITEPGIYFDVPDEVYHASHGLSSSGIKNILISPLDYWVQSIDPEREDFDTEANIFGKAMHRRTLEGRTDFYNHYAVLPDKDAHPDTHFTMPELKEMAFKRGWIKSGTRAEVVARIVKEDKDIQIFDDIELKFRQANEDKISSSPLFVCYRDVVRGDSTHRRKARSISNPRR